jgi:predicted dehydrogenase
MWAAYFAEREGQLGDKFGCATIDEVLKSHQVFEAAMESNKTGSTVKL